MDRQGEVLEGRGTGGKGREIRAREEHGVQDPCRINGQKGM